jgi:hypothetical protein
MNYPGTQHLTIGGTISQVIQDPSTERLLIIGLAQDGPINTPIRVTSLNQVAQLFGPASYQGDYKNPLNAKADLSTAGTTLPQAAKQALDAGCQDVYICRATGVTARSSGAFTSTLDMRAQYPGCIYNQVYVSAYFTSGSAGTSTITFNIYQPPSKGGAYTTVVPSSMLVQDFITVVNGAANNNTIYINPATWPLALTSPVSSLCLLNGATTTFALSGSVTGTNGCRVTGEDYATDVSGYANMLTLGDTGTFDTLLGLSFPFALCVLTGIYLDDQATNISGATTLTTIATDLCYFCENASVEIQCCHGVIGTRPSLTRNPVDLISYINNNLLSTTYGYYPSNTSSGLRWLNAGPFLNAGWVRQDAQTGNLVDSGRRLSVCAGPDVVYTHPDIGTYVDNFHVSYAAALTTYAPEYSPQFKSLPGIAAYGTPYPQKYCDALDNGVGYASSNGDLSGKGAYVCLVKNKLNQAGPLVVFDDPTTTARTDYFRQYQLVHLANSIHTNLDFALIGFLGGPTDSVAMAAMQGATQNILDGFVNSGAFSGGRGKGYDFKIYSTGTDSDLGVIRVDIWISPARSLRRIYFSVTVQQ